MLGGWSGARCGRVAADMHSLLGCAAGILFGVGLQHRLQLLFHLGAVAEAAACPWEGSQVDGDASQKAVAGEALAVEVRWRRPGSRGEDDFACAVGSLAGIVGWRVAEVVAAGARRWQRAGLEGREHVVLGSVRGTAQEPGLSQDLLRMLVDGGAHVDSVDDGELLALGRL